MIFIKNFKFMKFAKQSKKYFSDELKGTITNYFDFTIKNLFSKCGEAQGEIPHTCQKCKLPLTNKICVFCKTENKSSEDTVYQQTFLYKQKMQEEQKMEQSMILLVDLSGSMSCTYKSQYKKINKQFVSRILGEKNYQFLVKKIGQQKVLNNYSVYQMLLNEGETARNIADMVKMQQMNKNGSSSSSVEVNSNKNANKKAQQKQEPPIQYISRKQIIEVAVSKCLQIMKGRCPKTHITVVYFNNFIQIPTQGFNQKLVIAGIQDKSVDQMINLGVEYSTHISKSKAENIGENLIMHLTKASQNGQTALGPALAFCFGLAKAFKFSLHQISVITDGMSNVGFGQTQNQLQHEIAEKFYQKLALQYAKPLNCLVNILTFQDCCIGYNVLDRLVSITGGIPCQIEFNQQGGQKVVKQQTFSNLSFKMVTAFCQYAKNLCYQTKTTICCDNQKITLQIGDQLRPFVQQNKGNIIVLKPGIRSSGSKYEVKFTLNKNQQDFEGTLKFTTITQFQRKSIRNVLVTTQKIKVTKGSKEKAEKQQTISIQKQIQNTLKKKQIFQQNIQQYYNLSMKIQQNPNILSNLDQQMLQKFKNKKQAIEEQFKNVDKLTREKLSMRSRAQKTYKEQEDDLDDGFV